MHIPKRPAIIVAASLAAATIASPALAAKPVKMHHTSLNARAMHAVVAPRHTDTVSLTLRSGKSGVAGEEANFLVRDRHNTTNAKKWGAWTAVTATAGAKAGQYKITVTLPAALAKGQKEQFQVKFAGDPANKYTASRSQVFTVKAS